MRFMLMVYLDEENEARKSTAEREEMLARRLAHSKEWKRRGIVEAAEMLHPTSLSTTVRVRDGRTILTDGPFAETREQLGGYYIVDCANQDEALRLAAELSGIRRGPPEAVEVRPVWEFRAG